MFRLSLAIFLLLIDFPAAYAAQSRCTTNQLLESRTLTRAASQVVDAQNKIKEDPHVFFAAYQKLRTALDAHDACSGTLGWSIAKPIDVPVVQIRN